MGSLVAGATIGVLVLPTKPDITITGGDVATAIGVVDSFVAKNGTQPICVVKESVGIAVKRAIQSHCKEFTIEK